MNVKPLKFSQFTIFLNCCFRVKPLIAAKTEKVYKPLSLQNNGMFANSPFGVKTNNSLMRHFNRKQQHSSLICVVSDLQNLIGYHRIANIP